MERMPLLLLPEGMLIDQIQITETGLVVSVIATHPTSCCPLCSDGHGKAAEVRQWLKALFATPL